MRTAVFVCCLGALAAASQQRTGQTGGKAGAMDRIAGDYVKLVLALGQHDRDYVDAYYGPPEWKKAAESSRQDLSSIGTKAGMLVAELAKEAAPADEMGRLRQQYLDRQ